MSQSAPGRRARAGISLVRAVRIALLGGTVILAACGGGGGGGGGGTATPQGNDYTPGTGTGTALLSWSAPTERVDGRALSASDIAAYRIHFGPSSDPSHYLIQVDDGSQSQYTITGLDPDTWQFTLTVVDTAGRESGESNSMNKTIN